MVQETEAQEVLQQPLDLLRQMAVAAEAVVIQALDFLEALEEERLEDFQEVLDQEIHLLELHLKEILEDHLVVLHLTQELAVEELLLQAVIQQEETAEMEQQVQSMHLQ